MEREYMKSTNKALKSAAGLAVLAIVVLLRAEW
jgi:hypothetical protein